MADSNIVWTPEDGGDAKYVVLTGDLGSFSLQGWSVSDSSVSRSIGRHSVCVMNDSHDRYTLEVRNVHQLTGTGATGDTWFGLVSWLSHCMRGGRFAFQLDSEFIGNTTISSFAVDEGDVELYVDDDSDFGAGSWCRITHLSDPTIHEVRRVKTTSAGLLTLHSGVTHDYPIGSIVRVAGYLPTCVAVISSIRFNEHPSGDLWDLLMDFETVI